MQHGRVAAEVGVVVFQHLGVIGGQAHEDQQTDSAEHKVHDAEAKAEQAEQPAHQAADDQGNQTAHELGAPAGQVTVGDVAVHRHNAEVDRTDEERQNQAAEVIREEDGAQIQAVEHRVGEEDARGRGRLQRLHPGRQHEHQHQLRDGGQDEQARGDERVDQPRHHCADTDQERDQQTGKHPAEGLGHKLGKRTKGAFRIRNIRIIAIHSCNPLSLGSIIAYFSP